MAARIPHNSSARTLLRSTIACIVLGVATLVSGGAPTAHAINSGGGLAIQPTSSNTQAGVTNRSKFTYKLKPGSVQTDSVVVSNLNDTARLVTVYVANAFTTTSGKIGVRPNDQAKSGAVEWLRFTTKLGDGTIEIAGKSSATIPFTISIPPNAAPGDYAFGVAVAPVVEAPKPAPGQNAIQIVQAAATLVELRVDGPLIPIVRVGTLEVQSSPKFVPGFTGGTTTTTFEVVNIGNVRLNNTIHITEHNAFGTIIHTEPDIELNNLLPGSKVKITRSWANDAYIKGSVQIDITTDTDARETRSQSYWSVSWHSFVVPGALALLLLALWVLVRRRRRQKAGLPASPRPLLSPPMGAHTGQSAAGAQSSVTDDGSDPLWTGSP